MQRLLARRERSDQKADEERQCGKRLAEMAASCPQERDSVAVLVGYRDPEKALAKRRLPAGAFKTRAVEPTEKHRKIRGDASRPDVEQEQAVVACDAAARNLAQSEDECQPEREVNRPSSKAPPEPYV